MESSNISTARAQQGASVLAVEMRAAVTPVEVSTGDIIAHQGEEGQQFYYVDSGALDVVITSEEGLRLPVARLGPGSHFGEMSLLAGIPISADVVASETTVLYGVTAEEFEAIIRRKPELVEYLAGELALRLKQTNQQLAAQQQRQAILSNLIGGRHGSVFSPTLPSFDKKFAAAVEEAAQSEHPLLITGEKGAGKKTLAFYIHGVGARQQKPVLVVDCREVPGEDARSLLFGDAPPQTVSRFANRLGYLQAADRGTLILAHVDRLPHQVQEDLATFMRKPPDSTDNFSVAVRIIGTTEMTPEGHANAPRLTDALAQTFAQGLSIHLRPLRQRRRDVLPLAEFYLQQAAQLSGQPQKELGESARRKLLSYEFRFNNAEELRQVVNLGAELAEGRIVNAEHLFFGAGVDIETPQLDLLRWPRMAQLLTGGRLLRMAKTVIGVFFAAIAFLCLLAPSSLAGQVANVMVWGLWWPGLILLSLFFGRIWCAVCPLSSGAEILQRHRGRAYSPWSRMKDAWPLPALVGFAGILWIEHMTQMSAHPRATAFLLISLGIVAAGMGWLFQRHTWCRYLCPLGAMGAAFSTASALRVRARREVCQASCIGNECYKGSPQAQGCPMFNHALFLNSGEHCKLCLECIRACPVQSPRLILQLPLRDIWRSELISTEAAPITVVVGLMAFLLAALPASGVPFPHDHWWFSLGTLVAVGAGAGAYGILRPAKQETTTDPFPWVGRVIYAFAPAVAAVLCAFHLRFVPGIGEVSIQFEISDRVLWHSSLRLLGQGVLLGVGGLMTWWTVWRLCRQRFTHMSTSFAVWLPLSGIAFAYLLGTFLLFGRG